MKIIDMITGGGPLAILEKIDQDKASIRVEVEGSNLQFVSRLSVKGESVLIAKPPGLNQGLEKGKFVRFKVPGGGSHEIRLEIAAPHFNLNSGATVFLCRLPEKII
ncbi:MAG: hypothetical protein OEZ59_12860, partial [Deltaproteobacteria bacterium]|nr:hypothetical protein [Deltaproteobacteria bacterium]